MYTCLCKCTCAYTCVHVYMSMCVCVHACAYVCMCVCAYVPDSDLKAESGASLKDNSKWETDPEGEDVGHDPGEAELGS